MSVMRDMKMIFKGWGGMKVWFGFKWLRIVSKEGEIEVMVCL